MCNEAVLSSIQFQHYFHYYLLCSEHAARLNVVMLIPDTDLLAQASHAR
jgi:hypothetical protein